MSRRLRVPIVVAALCSIVTGAAGQTASVLHIKVTLLDAERRPTPVPRHALLVSDNPATETPRRVVTGADGTAEVRLRPGNYTVESDAPLAFNGKAYQWTRNVDVRAGRDAVLELTAGNAEIGPITAETTTNADAPLDSDVSLDLARWQTSVVMLWTPTAHASGFVIGADGLIVTNQRSIGAATDVEVQMSATVKVAAKTLAADAERDVAVLRIDPATAASVPAVPLACAPATPPAVAGGQKIYSIGVPLGQPKDTASGTVSRLSEHEIESDLFVATGGEGGPVFTADGAIVGLTSITDDSAGRRHRNSRIVRLADVCAVAASARQSIKDAAPNGTHLPLEPTQPFPSDALKAAAQRRGGSPLPFQITSSTFDITFITPALTFAAQDASRRERSGGTSIDTMSSTRSLLDFANWSDYVADSPPVLLVRVTPKLVEGFWTKVARGAAQTQGVAIPPIKRIKSGFLRMRALCGDAEVTPIHPFKIERRVSDAEVLYEGLYVFDPNALGPSCGSVKLVLYGEKEPAKGDTQIVDPKVIERVWEDFAAYRAVR